MFYFEHANGMTIDEVEHYFYIEFGLHVGYTRDQENVALYSTEIGVFDSRDKEILVYVVIYNDDDIVKGMWQYPQGSTQPVYFEKYE